MLGNPPDPLPTVACTVDSNLTLWLPTGMRSEETVVQQETHMEGAQLCDLELAALSLPFHASEAGLLIHIFDAHSPNHERSEQRQRDAGGKDSTQSFPPHSYDDALGQSQS